MPPLYVVQQNAKLRLHNRRVQVEMEENGETRILTQIPIGQVSQIVLFGNIGLTTPLMDALLGKGIEVIFLSQQGEFRGVLSGELTPHVPLRRAQYRALENPAFVLQMAKALVRAKLEHQRALLQRHNRERGDPQIDEAAARLSGALDSLPKKVNLNSLRGLEGSATAAYFGGFRRLFDPQWNFNARLRRPRRGAGPLRRLSARGGIQPPGAGAGLAGGVPPGGGRPGAVGGRQPSGYPAGFYARRCQPAGGDERSGKKGLPARF